MAVRFMPDGRLRLPSGVTLDRGSNWLSRAEAESMCGGADRVFYHFYPQTVEITADPCKVAALISRIDTGEHIVYARLYTGRGLRVVVLDEHH